MDSSSMAWSTRLAIPKPDNFNQAAADIPLYDKVPQATSGIPILTTAKVGDWHGVSSREFPIQILDAIRDILLQYIWGLNIKLLPDQNLMGVAVDASSDKEGMSILSQFNISPAAWSSRHARIWAIESATTSLH